uniref:Uncharacterized protein n=1 Tax=Rhizophagus irregularis (strain DAOM 181602 / DAOM 197198 / MUCL 43194) TaxID=747089 RepID=U9UA84_RHIID
MSFSPSPMSSMSIKLTSFGIMTGLLQNTIIVIASVTQDHAIIIVRVLKSITKL